MEPEDSREKSNMFVSSLALFHCGPGTTKWNVFTSIENLRAHYKTGRLINRRPPQTFFIPHPHDFISFIILNFERKLWMKCAEMRVCSLDRTSPLLANAKATEALQRIAPDLQPKLWDRCETRAESSENRDGNVAESTSNCTYYTNCKRWFNMER